jgi:hypothetical protein
MAAEGAEGPPHPGKRLYDFYNTACHVYNQQICKEGGGSAGHHRVQMSNLAYSILKILETYSKKYTFTARYTPRVQRLHTPI